MGPAEYLRGCRLGSGFFRLRLSLALNQVKNGVILVDELEDGLHFSIFPQVARLIYTAFRNKSLQIFVATHSGELIRAFVEIADELKFEDLCLVNMAPLPQGITTQHFDKSEMQYALELDGELR